MINRFVGIIFLITALSLRTKEDKIVIAKSAKTPAAYTSEIVDQWLALSIKIMSSTIASFNGPFVRVYSYSGIVAYEAISPGLPAGSKYLLNTGQFNQFPAMPQVDKNQPYHWSASLNAAMAEITRDMFPFTNPVHKASIDSLEKVFENKYREGATPDIIDRSAAFGKNVAKAIYNWGESDGYKLANRPFRVPTGPGKWEPTPPNFAQPSTPYWGDLRTIVKGSIANTTPPPPPEYSEADTSSFYKMIQDVYETDQGLTEEQKNIALFWRDINPGISAPGHWMNILRQVFQKEKTTLDKAAYTFALTGIALNDAWISCWKTRYEYNLMRPVTYIRRVMNHSNWLPYLLTPPHPEYTSGFAAIAGSITQMLTNIYGSDFSITDHTYDYLGMTPRSFTSFASMAEEAGISKFYGGIHYRVSVDYGLWQGREVATNIATKIISGNAGNKGKKG